MNMGDHSKAVKDLLNASVDCYMLEETAEAKGVLNHHRTKILKFNTAQKVGSFWVLPMQMYHDVPCAGFFIVSIETGQKLLFATDTYMIEYNLPNLNYIMIEANYSLDLISDDAKQDRTYRTHMSIDTCIKYLKSIDLSNVRTIYLMHLSSRNSDALDFKRRVQAATGKPVYICSE